MDSGLKEQTMPTTISGNTGVSQVQDGVITVEDLNGGGSGSAPIFGCRAWVNFDGTRDSTGATSTANTNRFIRASGNVASVLRNGAGDYTITFTTAMPDANFAASVSSQFLASGAGVTYSSMVSNNRTTSSVRVISVSNSFAATDSEIMNVAIFR